MEVKFDKVEKTFNGVTTVRWELDTKEGRFTAPEYLTLEQVGAAMAEKKFVLGKDRDTGVEFKTAAGLPVWVYQAKKVLESGTINIDEIQVSSDRTDTSALVSVKKILKIVE